MALRIRIAGGNIIEYEICCNEGAIENNDWYETKCQLKWNSVPAKMKREALSIVLDLQQKKDIVVV